MILPAILAAGAASGGAKLGAGAGNGAVKAEAAVQEPGPTVPLDPFLVTLTDPQKSHVLKLSIAVELKHDAKDEEFKVFVPRIRDSTLTYLRALTFEEASSSAKVEQMRKDLVERFKGLGVASAERVLVTDLLRNENAGGFPEALVVRRSLKKLSGRKPRACPRGLPHPTLSRRARARNVICSSPLYLRERGMGGEGKPNSLRRGSR